MINELIRVFNYVDLDERNFSFDRSNYCINDAVTQKMGSF